MKPLMGRIQDGDVLICDGAMGTHLMAAGVEPGSCLEALNTERPELPEQVSSMYVEAGADVVMTNTLGASPTALARHGLEMPHSLLHGKAKLPQSRAHEHPA